MKNGSFEQVNNALLAKIPRDQLVRVLEEGMCDIEPDFLGFVDIYAGLAQVIPLHWTIVDLGCAYAPQAWLFDRHKRYIGVDLPGEHFGREKSERFSAPNSAFYEMTIGEFIERHIGDFDQDTTFAICSYVPPWYGDNRTMVRRAFQNVFTYYPARDPDEPDPFHKILDSQTV